MKPVYQTIADKNKGNCMQAVIASLFDVELNEIPNFIEFDSWFEPLYKIIQKFGYEYNGILYNKKYSTLNTPTHECYHKIKWSKTTVLTPKRLYKESGVNGYFYAGVYSPKYFNWEDQITHAVIIDKDYNVVHDPNPSYKDIFNYPLTSVLGYNGIIDVCLINKKNK